MSFKKTIKRELEVAFSPTWQPIWVRVIKYAILGILIFIFRDKTWFWITLGILFVLSLIIHFLARYKTRGRSKSYGKWKYFKSKYDEKK